jgi:hypothetical protein
MSAEEKAPKIAELRADIKKYQEQADKAEHSAYQKKLAAFVEAEKADNKPEMKKLIGEFAAAAVTTPTN